MKVIIENLCYMDYEDDSYSVAFTILYKPNGHTKPAVEALLGRVEFVENLAMTEEMMDISITCKGIIVRDDLISIEFPDGCIADYEIDRRDYHRIIIS